MFHRHDIILMSASVVNLQKMLDICYTNGCVLDIQFNATKSLLFLVGKSYSRLTDGLMLGGDNISWCEKNEIPGHYI